jgi:hypothetical protein
MRHIVPYFAGRFTLVTTFWKFLFLAQGTDRRLFSGDKFMYIYGNYQ